MLGASKAGFCGGVLSLGISREVPVLLVFGLWVGSAWLLEWGRLGLLESFGDTCSPLHVYLGRCRASDSDMSPETLGLSRFFLD